MADLIVALDYPARAEALDTVERLGDLVGHYKVGSELFTRAGPELVRELVAGGKAVFLDLKFHDIPNTVRGAVEAAAELGIDLLTVHAAGGPDMLRAARSGAGAGGPRVLAVTVLTSMDAPEIGRAWGRERVSPADEVERLAHLAVDCGLDGVVASPAEAASLRRLLGPGRILVTPGIRAAGEGAGDQRRTATPGEAVRAGSDYLVVGRPVTRAADPVAAVRRIRSDMDAQLQPAPR